jgi:hypothetical protein
MASARKDPTRLRAIVRSPDSMDLRWVSASLAFLAKNAGMMGGAYRRRYIEAAEIAEIV